MNTTRPIQCERCGKRGRVPTDFVGKIHCPGCRHVIELVRSTFVPSGRKRIAVTKTPEENPPVPPTPKPERRLIAKRDLLLLATGAVLGCLALGVVVIWPTRSSSYVQERTPPPPDPLYRPNLRPFLIFHAAQDGREDFVKSLLIDFHPFKPPMAANEPAFRSFESIEKNRVSIKDQYSKEHTGERSTSLESLGFQVMDEVGELLNVATAMFPDRRLPALWLFAYALHVRGEMTWLLSMLNYEDFTDGSKVSDRLAKKPFEFLDAENQSFESRDKVIWMIIAQYDPSIKWKSMPRFAVGWMEMAIDRLRLNGL